MNQLFTYGTLRPGHANAHILGNMGGKWQIGYVRGVVHILDWGPDQGLPALVLDPQAEKIEGLLFSTEKLADNWEMLDDFEGFQYQRVMVDVELESGEMVQAWTYQMHSTAKSAHI
ncbi:gamma-glutamylcyclotransferase family protein [Acinetobacter sp. ANC 4641]|uniref:gamma-glutamylcyclotransferase family protein n=1 Tax=Acinetobacter sp. ANC 4641 TaxID=2529847 RepID=UPI00103F515C|nr:gamma-glutamylcyclotransferase family protein [Acinetobacter sp. ANC 4641]TCB11590.1 gamma-glutamylcyclotransferase [Acinetobacter sp. ANC 4641]